MHHSRSTALLAAAAMALAACGESGPPVPVPTSISLSTPAVTLNALGASQTITATVKDQSGQAMTGQTVTWNSANTAIATVGTANGMVTAVANGETQVTATSGTLNASATVTVAQTVAQLAKTGGDAQAGTVGTQLGTALEVEARDSQGHVVPGSVASANIAFAVTQGNGSVSQASVAIGANGRAATQFTLGTASGTAHQVTATVGSASTQFTATGTAAPADTLAYVSGDGQTVPKGAAAPQPLAVRAADQYGNPVPGYQVNFAATAGGGSLSPASAMTGANGQVSSVWTMGSAVGAQTAEAQASTAITGSPVAFSATAIDFFITAIAPDTIVEGATATITGAGFSTTPANNTVMIDGTAAAVTAATSTSLTVTVPSYACRPARAVDVQVTVSSVASNIVSHPLYPPAFVTLATGDQQIILDPASFCLQFKASAASEAYLVGVQSLSETPSNLTATRLITSTGFASPGPPGGPIPAPAPVQAPRTTPLSPRGARWLAHRRAEATVLDENAQIISAMPISGALPRAPRATAGFVGPGVVVGDTVRNLRVTTGGGTCSTYNGITTVVRAKGARSIWLEDVANPANGYTAADFDSLSKYMDNVIFDADTSYFGNPGDQDGNSRIVVIVTNQVNQRSASLLGFVTSCDFYARTVAPTSNEGEFFYAKAPDPTGLYGSVYLRSDAILDAPFLIGHEFTHIIQFAVRLPLAGAVFTSWLLEGQATLAEEVVGHARTGLMPGQNYGFSVAFNNPPSTDIDWYSDGFVDLAVYFGFLTSTTKVAQAPHECTWIGRQDEGNTGPCLSGREVYGVPWSIFRWVSDQFGPGYAGGERGLQKAIILNPSGGYGNVAGTVGVSIDTLLAQWAAMLYVDDRVPSATPRLTLPSWNMLDVFNHLVASANLQPAEVGFSAFDQARNVRAGSTAYFRISGSGRPATAVRARSSTDTALPGTVNVWVVRLQ